MSEDPIGEYMDYLYEVGAMLPEGMDSAGEMTYRWADDDVLESIDPELVGVKRAYEAYALRCLEDEVIEMYQQGLVEIVDMDFGGEVLWGLTQKGIDALGD
jgi:hypothetical protein